MQKEFDALYGHLPSPPSQSEMQQYESVPVAYTNVVSKDSMASGPMDDETISLPDITDSFQTDDDSQSTMSTDDKKDVPKEQCPGCFKEFEHVMRHLGKSKACKDKVGHARVDEMRAEAKKAKKTKYQRSYVKSGQHKEAQSRFVKTGQHKEAQSSYRKTDKGKEKEAEYVESGQKKAVQSKHLQQKREVNYDAVKSSQTDRKAKFRKRQCDDGEDLRECQNQWQAKHRKNEKAADRLKEF